MASAHRLDWSEAEALDAMEQAARRLLRDCDCPKEITCLHRRCCRHHCHTPAVAAYAALPRRRVEFNADTYCPGHLAVLHRSLTTLGAPRFEWVTVTRAGTVTTWAATRHPQQLRLALDVA